MRADTCKFYNGDFHNTHCDAGVCYRDVTTDPDDINGVVFRKPCIVWDEPLVTNGKPSKHRQLSDVQKANYERRGTCDKFQFPTNEELDEYEAKTQARLKEIFESIENGVVPGGVMVCGPGTIGKCSCRCPDGPCEHKWDGKTIADKDAGLETVTCSVCGKWKYNHDMWIEE